MCWPLRPARVSFATLSTLILTPRPALEHGRPADVHGGPGRFHDLPVGVPRFSSAVPPEWVNVGDEPQTEVLVSSCGAPTGLDSGEPRSRSQIVNTAMVPTAR